MCLRSAAGPFLDSEPPFSSTVQWQQDFVPTKMGTRMEQYRVS